MKKPYKFDQLMETLNASVRKGEPFHIVFCTADLHRKTGGRRIEFKQARMTVEKGKSSSKPKERTAISKRYPVNIVNLLSQEIRAVHLDLIEYINGHPIL